MPNSYGLVVEGTYDEAALPEFVRRLASPGVFLRVFPCGGGARLMQKFPGYLDALQYEFQGGPVQKALVILDSNGQDPVALENEMQSKIAGRHYSFPERVQFCVVIRELEAWLLGDPAATNTIATSRSGRMIMAQLHQPPEALVDPKAELERRLRRGGVNYTSKVAREIATAADLHLLERQCPSFADFKRKALDC